MISSITQQRCTVLIQQMQLPGSFIETVSNIFVPLSQVLIDKKNTQPLLVSINGAQGTGKSTMTAFLKTIIESEMQCRVADLSLDDFYSVKQERLQLAETVHPLFATRGVPGTHDVALLEKVLEKLLQRQSCHIPRFDKAIDDRCDESLWTDSREPVDVILFEGWCNNSPPQDEQALLNPVNDLERNEDAEGLWRRYVNDRLIEYHQRIFDQADVCIMLKAPDFECIYEWRSLQEQKLRNRSDHLQNSCVMNDEDLARFIQHYERISRHTLQYLPDLADVVLPIAHDHTISSLLSNTENDQLET
jgi:D-glycerate 3-kinase